MTDAAGKKRAVAKDALGDISAVTEDPDRLNYTTLYGFNVLDELERVVQGTQTRTFVYDSLKRLTQATNPESGTVSYTYDNAGNLQTKTDSRGITTTYSHDCLNRLFHRASSDLSVDTWYTYDETAFANSTGRLTQVGEGSVLITYGDADAMGRVLHSSEQTSTQTYNFSYSYNLAGALTSEQYPSGRTIYTCYDGANRVSLVSKADGCQQNVPANYVNNVIYWPHGAPNTYSYGNNLQTVAQYNNRLQPVTLYANLAGATNGYLFQHQFCWTPEGCPNTNTDNNGNLRSIHTLAGGPDALANLPAFDQSFTYDGVNRLTAASDSGGWSRGFNYDPVGNMWVSANSGVPLAGNTPTSNVYNGNNQIVSGTYDAAGNQLVVNGDAILYDAENRQVQVTEAPGMGGGQVNYGYDGNGQRVQKVVAGGPTTVYVYDAFGQLAAEYSSGSTQAAPCTTCYLTYDHLGSVRLVTDENGTVVARHDYLPFGEEIPGSAAGRNSQWGPGTDTVSQKFTGKERDAETGLDFFGARYYGAALGRFTSPDPENAGGDPGDPQSWNGYAYARNNSLLLVDPTGRNYTVCDQQGQNCADLTDQQWSDFRDQNGIGQQAGGQLYVTNEDGSYTNVGTATYYNEQDIQAANFLNYQVTPVINALGYATAGVLTGVAVGAGYGAIADGARLIGSLGIASGPAIFQAGQTIDKIVSTSQGPVRFVAEVETVGSQLVLKDIQVYPTETGERLEVGVRQVLQASRDLLQQARQDGFTSVRFIGDRSLAEGSANPGRPVDFTRSLR